MMHGEDLPIFIWLIWDGGYSKKYIGGGKISLKCFDFYISIISLAFDENSGHNGQKK
jgi:hypothetical protein